MNNEIKEILKELKQHTWLEYEEMDKLLDYITNLQEKYDKALTDLVQESHTRMELENKITNLQEKVEQYENPDDLTLFYMWLDEKAKDKMKQLQEKNKRLKEIAHKMHLWIFLHSGDEQKVYDELGLTDEENAMLGYSGQFRIGEDKDVKD